MKYWKLVYYVAGDDYETREMYIDQPTFRKYQKAIMDKVERIILEDRVIKVSSIKEILPADDEVAEYRKYGLSYETIGLPEPPTAPTLPSSPEMSRLEKMKRGILNKTAMSSNQSRTESQEEGARSERESPRSN